MTSVLDMECSVDALMVTATPIAGTGASVGVKSAVTGWQDGGTFIDLGKESMGAKLWLRLLLFLAGITLTLRAVRFLNRRVHDALRDDRERLKSSYAVRLMPRFIRQGVMLALGYLLCAGAAAVLMQYVIAPVYTFPEWIPAVLVEWEEIGKAFWKCWQHDRHADGIAQPGVHASAVLWIDDPTGFGGGGDHAGAAVRPSAHP